MDFGDLESLDPSPVRVKPEPQSVDEGINSEAETPPQKKRRLGLPDADGRSPVSVSGTSPSVANTQDSPDSRVGGSQVDQKKLKKQGGNKPCLVCGIEYADMPKGSNYCYEHKADVDVLTKQLKRKRAHNEEGAEVQLKKFEDLRDKKESPPSMFSRLIYDFHEQCPSKGPRVERDAYSCVLLKEVASESKIAQRGFKCIKMHRERYIRWAQKELDLTAEEADSKWKKYDRDTAEDDKDQLGPSFSKLQLPIPVEEFVIGMHETKNSKELHMEGTRGTGIVGYFLYFVLEY